MDVILKNARRSREMADYTELAEFSREDSEVHIAEAEAFIQEVEGFTGKESS